MQRFTVVVEFHGAAEPGGWQGTAPGTITDSWSGVDVKNFSHKSSDQEVAK
jgi:hypothetical protein